MRFSHMVMTNGLHKRWRDLGDVTMKTWCNNALFSDVNFSASVELALCSRNVVL
jgi:hypothetical protein